MDKQAYAIEMLNITKRFPGIIANDNITLQLKKGEIHALLGENGAGKSTLMSVLSGLYQPEEGEIHKDGRKWRSTILMMRMIWESGWSISILSWWNVSASSITLSWAWRRQRADFSRRMRRGRKWLRFLKSMGCSWIRMH